MASSQVHNGILPGTSSTSMEHTYDWPLDWTPGDFAGDDVTRMANHLPEAYALITALGPTFIKRLTHALLARDGHFASLLLSTIWGQEALGWHGVVIKHEWISARHELPLVLASTSRALLVPVF